MTKTIRVTHTKGPWRVLEPVGTWIQTDGDPYGHGPMHIADVRGWGHLTGQGACRLEEKPAIAIQTANARLIAAAPELLTALRYLLADYEQLLGDGVTENTAPKQLLVARAAIAKAEGR